MHLLIKGNKSYSVAPFLPESKGALIQDQWLCRSRDIFTLR